MKYLVIIIFSLFCYSTISAQPDPVILEIEGEKIHLSEFSYIYEKNNRDNADYSKESLEEYLDLYINFKLKVQRAKELGYHKKESYQEELLGYRKQLADSYVIEREVVDRLADEVFRRKSKDIGLRHILVSVARNAPKQDQEEALRQINLVNEEIAAGMSFETAAREYSEDKNSSAIGGDIGYITGDLPDGYVDLEDAAYTMKVGEISQAIITDLGYHLLKVTDIRPARGTIEASHILLKKKINGIGIADAATKAQTVYQDVMEGKISYEDAVFRYSEDVQTKGNKGYLGFFGIGQYEKAFEDAAFNLTSDNAISPVVETSIGYHIIKRISKRPAADYDAIKQKIKSNEFSLRYQMQKRLVTEELKKEANYKPVAESIQIFKDSLTPSFYEYDWEIPNYPKVTMASFNNKSLNLNELAEFAKNQARVRMRSKGQIPVKELADEIVKLYADDLALAYAESKLEERYPEFKNLMREYEEGILLFEVTKDHVWDKAAKDTVGLITYFNEHRSEYVWKERAKLTSYAVRSIEPEVVSNIFKMARYAGPDKVKEAFNKERELVIAETDVYEKGSDFLQGLKWEVDVAAAPTFNNGLRVTTFKKIEEMYPPQLKEFKEAKGYIISDFQEALEKEWIAQLRKKYKYSINKKTLKQITK